MKRRGYSRETIKNLNHAFHLLLTSKLNTEQALQKIKEDINDCQEVDLLVEFIETSKRGVVK
jgi:UDP-N-acetylglucosamine acyltransferase